MFIHGVLIQVATKVVSGAKLIYNVYTVIKHVHAKTNACEMHET